MKLRVNLTKSNFYRGIFIYLTLLTINFNFVKSKYIHTMKITEILNPIGFYSNNLFIDIFFFLFKLFLIFLPILFLKTFQFNFFKFLIFGLYIFFFIPLIVFFVPIDWSSFIQMYFFGQIINEFIFEVNFFYFSVFILSLNFLILFLIENLDLTFQIPKKEINMQIFKKIIFITFFISLIYIFYELSFNYSIDANELLSFKKSLRSLLTGKLGYIINWSIVIFSPIVFYLSKSKFSKILIIINILLCAFIFKTKFYIFIALILTIYSFGILNKLIKRNDFIIIFLASIILYQFFYLIYSLLLYVFSVEMYDLYLQRIFFEQPKNYFIFFHFFSNNDYLYYTQYEPLLEFSWFKERVSIYSSNIIQHIQSIYRGGSPSANGFVLEGFSSFGVIGFFLVSKILILLGLFLNNCLKNKDHFLLIPVIIQLIYIFDAPLTVSFFTYGLFLTIILSFLKVKENN